jgi:hypothetical protein
VNDWVSCTCRKPILDHGPAPPLAYRFSPRSSQVPHMQTVLAVSDISGCMPLPSCRPALRCVLEPHLKLFSGGTALARRPTRLSHLRAACAVTGTREKSLDGPCSAVGFFCGARHKRQYLRHSSVMMSPLLLQSLAGDCSVGDARYLRTNVFPVTLSGVRYCCPFLPVPHLFACQLTDGISSYLYERHRHPQSVAPRNVPRLCWVGGISIDQTKPAWPGSES